MQYHAALTWYRSWLTTIGVAYIEHGDPGTMGPIHFEVDDGEGTTICCTRWTVRTGKVWTPLTTRPMKRCGGAIWYGA